MGQFENINRMVDCLSSRDSMYAHKYLNDRNWSGLVSLVDSAIKRTENAAAKEKDLTIDYSDTLYNMRLLWVEIQKYIEQIYGVYDHSEKEL